MYVQQVPVIRFVTADQCKLYGMLPAGYDAGWKKSWCLLHLWASPLEGRPSLLLLQGCPPLLATW